MLAHNRLHSDVPEVVRSLPGRPMRDLTDLWRST